MSGASTLQFVESQASTMSLGFQLFDRFTTRDRLAGEVTVSLRDKPYRPVRQTGHAIYAFLDLPPGAYTAEIRSAPETPYYLPAELPVTVPMPDPRWPLIPELRLADPNLMLEDPAQPAAYRAQRALVTLQPAIAYPFPDGATVVRGRVLAGGLPLAEARVRRPGDDLDFITGADGQFVLFFSDVSGMGETVTLRASHALHPDVDQPVDVQRGMTAATDIIMAP